MSILCTCAQHFSALSHHKVSKDVASQVGSPHNALDNQLSLLVGLHRSRRSDVPVSVHTLVVKDLSLTSADFVIYRGSESSLCIKDICARTYRGWW